MVKSRASSENCDVLSHLSCPNFWNVLVGDGLEFPVETFEEIFEKKGEKGSSQLQTLVAVVISVPDQVWPPTQFFRLFFQQINDPLIAEDTTFFCTSQHQLTHSGVRPLKVFLS